MRAGVVLAISLLAIGCIPPGISHGPRVREGMFISGTLMEMPTDVDEERMTGVLSVRLAAQGRTAGRLGQQFTLLVPMPVLTASLEDDANSSVVLLTTGEFYRETDHPNSARVPRGWGVQASLLSIAPYSKIGWYSARGGVHMTNGLGFYGGLLGVFPAPERVVWWPSFTIEVQPWSALTTALHLGGSVQFDIDSTEAGYQLMAGATFTFGGSH